jgi:HEAT repeat protein
LFEDIILDDVGYVYIGYHHVDANLAIQLALDLKQRGVPVWLDRLDVATYRDWAIALQNAMGDCVAFVPLLSPDYVASRYGQHEIEVAHERNIQLLPVLLRYVHPSELPPEVGYHYVDLTTYGEPHAYEHAIDSLYTQLQEHQTVQVKNIVSPESRYLNWIRARVELQKTALEFVRLSYPADGDTDEPMHRSVPLIEEHWGLNAPFVLRSDHETRIVGDITQLQATYAQYMLVGELGIGKTTTLQRMLIHDVQRYDAEPRHAPLPFYVSLLDWEIDENFAEFLQRHWFLKSDVMDWLSRHWANLYVDDVESLTGRRAGLVDTLRQWLVDNSRIHVVLACSVERLSDRFDLQLPTVYMQGLTASRIEALVNLLLGTQGAVLFWQKLLPESYWAWALRHALYLRMLLFVYQHSPQGELPMTPIALFMRWLEIRWEREQILQHPDWVPLSEILPTLGEFAFDLLNRDVPYILTRQQVESRLGDAGLVNLLTSVRLLDIQGDMVTFLHADFYHFLAAYHLQAVGVHPYLRQPMIQADGYRFAHELDRALIFLAGMPDVGEGYLYDMMDVDPLLAMMALNAGCPASDFIRREITLRLLRFCLQQSPDSLPHAIDLLEALYDGEGLGAVLQLMRDGPWHERKLATTFMLEYPLMSVNDVEQVLSQWERDYQPDILNELRLMMDDALPRLIHELYAKDWKMRRGAAWALGELGDKAAVVPLYGCLRDGDALVRREAIVALRHWRDAAIVDGLVKCLLDEDLSVRKVAVQAIADMGVAAIPSLLRLLASDNIQQKRMAIGALGRVGDVSAVPDILPYLQHADADIRAVTVVALGQIGHGAVVQHLAPLLEDATQPRWHMQTIGALAQQALERIGTEDAMKMLRRLFSNGKTSASVGSATRAKAMLTQVTQRDQEAIEQSSQGESGDASQEDDAIANTVTPTVKAQTTVQTTTAQTTTTQTTDTRKESDWVEALAHTKWQVRQQALTALGKTGKKKYLPALLAGLNDDDKQVRWAAIKSLASYPAQYAVEGLQRALYDADPLIASFASDNLLKLGQDTATPIFLEALQSVSADVRSLAISGLYRLDARACEDDLRALLHDSEVSQSQNTMPIGEQARKVLMEWGVLQGMDAQSASLHPPTSEPSDVIPQPVADDSDMIIYPEWDDDSYTNGIQAQTSSVLRAPSDEQQEDDDASLLQTSHDIDDPEESSLNIPSDDIWKAMLDDLYGDHWQRQQKAAKALIKFVKEHNMGQNIAFIERITAGIGHPESMVRGVVVEALAWLGDVHTVPLLIQALDDESWTVRVAIVRSLAKIGHASAIPKLVEQLNDDHALVREVAVQVLGEFQVRSAVPDLLDCLDDEGFVARAAIEALGDIGARDAVEPLIHILEGSDGQLQWSIIEALGKIGDPDAVEALLPYLQVDEMPLWDETGEHRLNHVTAKALEQIGTSEALQAIANWRLEQA